MKVLFVASECKPFIQTGDLADVITSLSQTLKKEGIEISVALPKYKDIPLYWTEKMESQCDFKVSLS